MEIEIMAHCDACDRPVRPLSPVPAEGGPRHLCPQCLHAFVAGEVGAMEGRLGIKGGESAMSGGDWRELDRQQVATPAGPALDPALDPATHYSDGTPRDWVALEVRAEDCRTLNQLAQTWRCSRDNVVGVLCRAVRLQVWPFGDVLTNYPEFQSWVERIVHAEQAPLREAFRQDMQERDGRAPLEADDA